MLCCTHGQFVGRMDDSLFAITKSRVCKLNGKPDGSLFAITKSWSAQQPSRAMDSKLFAITKSRASDQVTTTGAVEAMQPEGSRSNATAIGDRGGQLPEQQHKGVDCHVSVYNERRNEQTRAQADDQFERGLTVIASDGRISQHQSRAWTSSEASISWWHTWLR